MYDKEAMETLSNIESSMSRMCSLMEQTLKKIAEWHDDDNVHHSEENNLIKQIKEVKDVKDKS